MRTYVNSDYKIKDEVLLSTPGYKDLIEFMALHGIDIDMLARAEFEIIELSELYENSSEFDNISDTEKLIAIEKEDDKLQDLKENFEKSFEHMHHFPVSLVQIDSDAEGDVSESFWALCDYIKPGVYEIAEPVGWANFG